MVIIQVLAASLLLYTVLYYTESLFELLLTDHEHFHEVYVLICLQYINVVYILTDVIAFYTRVGCIVVVQSKIF